MSNEVRQAHPALVLVPREPTREMVTAFYGPELVGPSCTEHCASIYRAMLAAAPAVQPAPVPPSQTPDVHLAGSQECAPAAREADSRSLLEDAASDIDSLLDFVAESNAIRMVGGREAWDAARATLDKIDAYLAAPSGVPQDSAPLPLSADDDPEQQEWVISGSGAPATSLSAASTSGPLPSETRDGH
jgi:hypothetical protein